VQRRNRPVLREEEKIVIVTVADILSLLFVAALGLFYAELIASAEPDPLSEVAMDSPVLSV
jgi:hypothetical protein